MLFTPENAGELFALAKPYLDQFEASIRADERKKVLGELRLFLESQETDITTSPEEKGEKQE